MVVYFKKIIGQLQYWSYPLMRIERIFSKLYGAKLSSIFGVISGYYNITMDENSRKYTAITTEDGKYEFLYVPFGIGIAPSYLP